MKNNVVFTIVFLLMVSTVNAQDFSSNPVIFNHRLWKLDSLLRVGNKQALFETADYLDDQTEITEFLGHHVLHSTAGYIAQRLIEENTLFTQNEFVADTNTTKKLFTDFLDKNHTKIYFDTLTKAFIITPFKDRKVDFKLVTLTNSKYTALQNETQQLLHEPIFYEKGIDTLLQQKNPLALLKLSALLLEKRYHFNDYFYKEEAIVNLLRLATKQNLVVKNQYDEWDYFIEKDFYSTTKINQYIFFANHYQDYQWDYNARAFVNKKLVAETPNELAALFDALSSKTDSVAINAFIKLTTKNPDEVMTMADNYRKADIYTNSKLPQFEYRFLKQMVQLTAYCKRNNFDFKGSEYVKEGIDLLRSKRSFKERRTLENELIDSLTITDITAFEYWSLIYSNDYNLNHSAARIIDKFYSNNWIAVVEHQEALKLYLLKSNLFRGIQISGLLQNYIYKFYQASPQEINGLTTLVTNNSIIEAEKEKAIRVAKGNQPYKLPKNKKVYGSREITIGNFNTEFKKIINSATDQDDLEDKVSYLCSQIEYKHIGAAFQAIEPLAIDPYEKYSFITRDFGFGFIGNFEKPEVRTAFLEKYNSLSEFDLYAYYLTEAGIDFRDGAGKLDYDKIYDILKFDSHIGIAGGWLKDYGVYAITKLLEITFETTLGYPDKLCCSDNMNWCTGYPRALAWMHYLNRKNVLKQPHNQPISIAKEFD